MSNAAKPIVVVTGGSRGIGAATALLAGSRGYAVCVNYRTQRAAAEQIVSEIGSAGGEAVAVQCDVSAEADVVRLFSAVDAQLGPVTALVNNAAIVERQARVAEMDSARITRVFGTNVTGSFLCAREAIRRMSMARGGRGGAIVNVSSRAAVLGSPGEYIDYAASKAAIEVLTKGLAIELAAEGIRVNTVRPGIIDTEIHASAGEPNRAVRLRNSIPMGRAGVATEVARAILWLLSDEASASNGTSIDVAGGW
jgi:NAD(P)-dependent dehydrogenase (short-subunit alcohol dehydrogenase family)